MERILDHKILMIALYALILSVTLLSIYVFLAGGNFISILETLY